MFKLKKWTLMLPLAALALVAAGCSSNSSSSTSQSKKAQTLNWSEISSIVTNDPSMSTDTVSFQMMTNTQGRDLSANRQRTKDSIGFGQKGDH